MSRPPRAYRPNRVWTTRPRGWSDEAVIETPDTPHETVRPSHDTETRVRIVRAGIAAFHTRAFHETTSAVVAEIAKLPFDTAERHFPRWDGLVMAAVDRWNAERTEPVIPLMQSHGTVRFLRGIVGKARRLRRSYARRRRRAR